MKPYYEDTKAGIYHGDALDVRRHSRDHVAMTLVKCPKCELWTLPTPGDAWCPYGHGAIPLPPRKENGDDSSANTHR